RLFAPRWPDKYGVSISEEAVAIEQASGGGGLAAVNLNQLGGEGKLATHRRWLPVTDRQGAGEAVMPNRPLRAPEDFIEDERDPTAMCVPVGAGVCRAEGDPRDGPTARGIGIVDDRRR